MSAFKREWQAAIAYLLILILVINVHVIGMADFSFYGINISIYSLLACVIYSLFLLSNRDRFIQQHLMVSAGTLFIYLLLSSLYSGMMYVLGYEVNVLKPSLLQQANFSTWIALGPLLVILIHTIMSSVRGMILCLQYKDPDGRPYAV